MGATNLTLAIEGEVSLKDFAEAVSNWRALVDALVTEIAGKTPIEWTITELGVGSAIVTISGASRDQNALQSVVTGYGVTARALQEHRPIPYGSLVQASASDLTKVLGEHVAALRLETNEVTAILTEQAQDTLHAQPRMALGQVRGTVETLTTRRQLHFILYDAIFDRPVTCYLQEEQKEDLRNLWGRRVVVTGEVKRESAFGRPTAVKNIQKIAALPDVAPGHYKRARGILADYAGGERPEDTIRRLRDA